MSASKRTESPSFENTPSTVGPHSNERRVHAASCESCNRGLLRRRRVGRRWSCMRHRSRTQQSLHNPPRPGVGAARSGDRAELRRRPSTPPDARFTPAGAASARQIGAQSRQFPSG
jgi:hypothetical protein